MVESYLSDTHPFVSTVDTNLKAAGIIPVTIPWKGKTVTLTLAPNDKMGSGDRITGRMRLATASYLVKRDGNRCSLRTPFCIQGDNPFEHPESADFDHINGDRHAHYLWNLRLACHPCNSHIQNEQKFHRKSGFTPTTGPGEEERKDRLLSPTEAQTDTVKLSLDLWPDYLRWLDDTITERKSLPLKEAIYEAARVLKERTGSGSSQTTRRYITELTSGPTSPYLIESKIVRRRRDGD